MDLGRIYPRKLNQVSYPIRSILKKTKKSIIPQETKLNQNVRALNTFRNMEVKGILRRIQPPVKYT